MPCALPIVFSNSFQICRAVLDLMSFHGGEGVVHQCQTVASGTYSREKKYAFSVEGLACLLFWYLQT